MISVNKKYIPLFNGDTRYYIILGGRGSGKSFALSSFACGLSFEQKQRILYTRQTMTSAHLSIIPEFTEKIEIMEAGDRFTVNKTEIINKDSGSDILFKGIQSSSGTNTANLKSLNAITTWILDEAEELVDETIFDKINLSIRTKGVQNRIILVMNPTTKESWIYKRFFEDRGVDQMFNGVIGDTTYIHTDYRDNIKNLDESFLAQIEDIRLNKPAKYKHVILGAWLDKAEGVVLSNWSIGAFNDDLAFGFGQDFGFSIDPTTLVKVAVDKKHKKIYVKECIGKAGMSTEDIYLANLRYAGINGEIIADSAEPRLISEIKAKGLNIKACIKGAGSVTAGIKALQDYEIIVSPCSTEIVKELNNYVWHDKKSGVPIDAWNHRIDPIRYYAYPLIKEGAKPREFFAG